MLLAHCVIIRKYTHIRIHTDIHTHTLTCTNTHSHTLTCTHTHSHTLAHTRTHTDIHTHARTRIYTRTHLNTQTHAPPHQALLVALHLHPNRMCLSITHSLLIILPCCFILFVSGQTQPCQNVPEIFRAHTCCSRKLLARTASALMQKPKHALLPALKHAQQENTQHEHACAARLHTAPADETCSRPCAAYTGAA